MIVNSLEQIIQAITTTKPMAFQINFLKQTLAHIRLLYSSSMLFNESCE